MQADFSTAISMDMLSIYGGETIATKVEGLKNLEKKQLFKKKK